MEENKYISRELYHLVGRSSPLDDESNYMKLSQVLSSGWVSHPPHDQSWGATKIIISMCNSLFSEDLVVPSVTCFADIPIDAMDIHTSKYGKFGIGFRKAKMAQYGARPVTYIPLSETDWGSPFGAELLKNIEGAVKGFKKHLLDEQLPEADSRVIKREPSNTEEALASIQSVLEKDFLAFIKPFKLELSDSDFDNYYFEREWRKYGNMKCSKEEVSKILVAKGYVDRFREDHPEFQGIPLSEI